MAPSNELLFGSWRFAREVERPDFALVMAGRKGFQRLLISTDQEEALCPSIGPYFHFASAGEGQALDFFRSILDPLKLKGCNSLIIRLPPLSYYSWVRSVQAYFQSLPGTSEIQEVNYHIPLLAPFKDKLPADQRRVLRLAEETGYTCAFTMDWPRIREMVSRSRVDKGFSDAISLEVLERLASTFPNRYLGISCQHRGEWAGAGVLILVDGCISYLFYVANHPDHLRYSPSLHIINFCAEWARSQGFIMLDLGTASKDGAINQGLKNFKESIGGVLSIKSWFRIPF